MTRRLLLFFVILHICVGSAIAIFHGPFYGDAQNFYGHAETIGSVSPHSNRGFEFVPASAQSGKSRV